MTRQIATFNLGGTLLGLDILLVREVYRGVSTTPIPDAPDHIRGLMNLRGRVVTVMDLNVCLNRPQDTSQKENYLLILKTQEEIRRYQKSGLLTDVSLGDDIAGFLIDQMDDVIEIEQGDLLPTPPNLQEVEGNLVAGVIQKTGRLAILLDINAILERIMEVVETER